MLLSGIEESVGAMGLCTAIVARLAAGMSVASRILHSMFYQERDATRHSAAEAKHYSCVSV